LNLDSEVTLGPLATSMSNTNIDFSKINIAKIKTSKTPPTVLQSYFEGAGSCCVEFLDAGGRQIAISSALPGEYVVIRALQPMLGRYVDVFLF